MLVPFSGCVEGTGGNKLSIRVLDGGSCMAYFDMPFTNGKGVGLQARYSEVLWLGPPVVPFCLFFGEGFPN